MRLKQYKQIDIVFVQIAVNQNASFHVNTVIISRNYFISCIWKCFSE